MLPFDCVYFVSVDYDSITAYTRKFQQSSGKFRRFVRCDVHAKIFCRRGIFFDGAKIFKKLDRVVAIDSVKKSSKSELSSRFLSRSKYGNSHATFGRIQPIVPGFTSKPFYNYKTNFHRDVCLNSSKSGV